MATAQDIIDASTLMLGLRSQGTAFSTYDSSANTDAFTALQDFIAQYAAENKLHIPTPSATSDTLDLYPEQIRSLKYAFAVDLMNLFRVAEIPQALASAIREATKDLESDNNIDISADLSDFKFTSSRYDITRDA